MSTQDEARRRVVALAREAFVEEGVKGVTMDSIAHRLNMSKRTIYQLFTDKEDLLLTCIKAQREEERARLHEEMKHTASVLDLILLEFDSILSRLNERAFQFFEEIERFHRVRAYFEEERAIDAAAAIDFFKRGITQGLFRPEVNFDIIYPMIYHQMEYVVRSKSFDSTKRSEVFLNTVIITLRGCTTPLGASKMDSYISRWHTQE